LVDNNNLSGPIPASLGGMANLQLLDLANNRLSGAIPATLGDLERLRTLDLANNQLSGSLPETLTSLVNLTWLNLSDNQLTGSIPGSFDQLTDLFALLLSDNRMIGSIPESLGNLTDLYYLHLNGNQLSGSIPESLGNLSKLRNLILYGNRLAGQIPAALGDLVKLEYLYLHSNQLSGQIPVELGKLADIFALSLGSNPFGGSLPAELGDLAELEHLYLYNNQLEGPIPAEFGNLAILKTLILAGNQLSGPIPATFGNLTMLETLNLYDNRLSGPIPSELGGMSDLQELDLESNQLSGAVPDTFSNLTNIQNTFGLFLGWNALYTDNPDLEQFLNIKTGNVGWDSLTQTVAPRRVRVSSLGIDSATLEWEPIDYTAQSGGYRVWYKPSSGEVYVDGGITADKNSTSHTVSGLVPGETYTFRVTTETNPHASNNNLVVSEPSLDLTIKPTETAFQMNVGLNDAWYYPVTNGQGFFITVFPDIGYVSLSWFTYDTEQQGEDVIARLGEAGHRWLNAVGAYSGNEAVLDISYATGGLFDTPTETTELYDGTIILTFTDCENGTVEYDIPSAGLKGVVPIRRVVIDNVALCESHAEQFASMQINRTQKTDSSDILSVNIPDPVTEAEPLVDMNVGLNDAWYYPTTDGQGFFITVFPDIGYVLLSWFTYDTERPAEDVTAIVGEPGHRWFNALGAISGNSAILDITIASGGLFDSPKGISESHDGTITLTFETCESGTVEYDIPSINQKGTVPIQRVAADNVALCEALISE
jgi:Leucine-rich repeat (LRR) protein